MVGVVVGYQAHWSTQQHTGEVKLRVWFGGGFSTTDVTIDVSDSEEMQLLTDLLRNEKPIWFDTAGKVVRTGNWEGVGEGGG